MTVDGLSTPVFENLYCMFIGKPISRVHARLQALPSLYTIERIANFARSIPPGIDPDYAAFISIMNSFPIADLIAAYRQIFPDPVQYPHPDPDRQVLPAADYQRFSDYVYSFPMDGGGGPSSSSSAPSPLPSSSNADATIVLNEYRMQMLAHLWREPLLPIGAVTQPFLDYMTHVNGDGHFADVGSFIRAYRVHTMINLTQSPVSDAAVDLIHGLLRENPADRLTIAQVRAHAWMTDP